MDVREKLVELIAEAKKQWEGGTNNIDGRIADHLIAHGVTVQEWVKVEERTPTEADGTVLVCLADVFPYNAKEPFVNAKHDRRVTEASHSEFSNRWYTEWGVLPDGDVTHWMEKPKPPKGD